MGCQCCRMIKSYIYDPSVAGDVHKSDTAGSSLYQPHHIPGETHSQVPHSGSRKQKHGFLNLGYSRSNDGTLKLEADRNQVNRLYGDQAVLESPQQGRIPPDEGGLYIIQPQLQEPRWVMQNPISSHVPIYPKTQEYPSPSSHGQPDRTRHYGNGMREALKKGWDDCEINGSLSADEVDEGMGGTPEYPCDTGDEESVISGDINTSTTSLSSVEMKNDRGCVETLDALTVESGISVTKSEEDQEGSVEKDEQDDTQSITESMVAEALAALEAATAGEDFE